MKKSSLTLKLINAPYMIWAVLFILAPLIMVIYYAFTDRSGAFTLDNIKALSSYGAIFGRSAWYAVLATVICLILAYPLAYIMAKSRANTQRTIMMLIMLPMWMNFLIRTYSWITILSNTGLINSLLKAVGLPTAQLINTPGAVILGMVYNFLPYMVLPIYSVMSKLIKALLKRHRISERVSFRYLKGRLSAKPARRYLRYNNGVRPVGKYLLYQPKARRRKISAYRRLH